MDGAEHSNYEESIQQGGYTIDLLEQANRELREALSNLANDIESLSAESQGVYGLHLNGDVSPWEEIMEGGRFERISSFEKANETLAKHKP